MNLRIRLMTWSRLPLAAAVALAWGFGHFELGAWLFTVGLFTKAADTFLGDRLGCPIPADDKLYRWVAIGFNLMATMGLTIGMFSAAMAREISWCLAIVPFSATSSIMLASSLFVRPHSKFAKVRSGVVSAILALCLAPVASTLVIFLCSFWIASGEAYKLCVYKTAETR